MTRRIDDKVAQALSAVNALFPELENQEGRAVSATDTRFIVGGNLESLVSEYESSLGLGSIIQDFTSAASSISAMRSSHLPSEFFQNYNGVLQEVIGSDYVELESHENAFMRMLGLPDSQQLWDESVGDDSTLTESLGLTWAEIMTQLDTRQDVEFRCQYKNDLINTFFELGDSVDSAEKWESISDEDITEIIGIKERVDALRGGAAQEGEDGILEEEAKITQDSNGDDLENAPERNWLYRTLFQRPAYNGASSSGEEAIKSPLEQVQEIRDQQGTDQSLKDRIMEFVSSITSELRLSSMHENFLALKLSLLLPISDSRISNCINEPSKIVAKPFSHYYSRRVSGQSLKSSLLETIIRIRFDRVSGVGAEVDMGASSSAEAEQQFAEGQTVTAVADLSATGDLRGDSSVDAPTQETLGILEALLIIRLNASIRAYARTYMSATGNMLLTYAETSIPGSDPNSSNNFECGNIVTRNISPRISQDQTEATDVDAHRDVAITRIKNMKLIEESILTLFGDTSAIPGNSRRTANSSSNVLDLQVGIERSSSVTDGHLVAPVLSVVSAPLKRLNSRLAEENRSRSLGARRHDEDRATIQSVLGIPTGVGAIDVAVYTLALFSLDEADLLGLLSYNDFLKLVNGPNGAMYTGVLVNRTVKPSAVTSLRKLSDSIREGYMMFQDGILNNQYINPPASGGDDE